MSIFSKVPAKKLARSRFNLTHKRLLAMNEGELLPIMLKEALPGDYAKLSSGVMARFAPTIAPTYQEMDGYMYSYYVPYRILNYKFDDFISGSRNGKKLSEDLIPVMPWILGGDLQNICEAASDSFSLNQDYIARFLNSLGYPISYDSSSLSFINFSLISGVLIRYSVSINPL